MTGTLLCARSETFSTARPREKANRQFQSARGLYQRGIVLDSRARWENYIRPVLYALALLQWKSPGLVEYRFQWRWLSSCPVVMTGPEQK